LCEVDGVRLPVGVQLVGRPFDESGLIAMARTLERGLSLNAVSPFTENAGR